MWYCSHTQIEKSLGVCSHVKLLLNGVIWDVYSSFAIKNIKNLNILYKINKLQPCRLLARELGGMILKWCSLK